MLSDKELEKLIQPIIDRQEALNIYVIRKIAQRVKEIGELSPSDAYKLRAMFKSGADVKAINQELARVTGMNESAIKRFIRVVAESLYADMKPFYDYRHKSYIPLSKNAHLMRIVNAIARQTANTYVNLSRSTAFMIRDLKNPKILKPTSLSDTYQTVMDEAIQAVQGGVIDYPTAMKRTMTQLADSGIRSVEYHPESGRKYTQRLDTAVRRNLMDSVRQINQEISDATGKEYGADGKEISVHAMSAPDHEPFQGHQFTNAEFEKLQSEQPFTDLDGETFPAVKRAIGVWNCHHLAFNIICGVVKPNFTKEQLEKYKEDNQRGYTDKNGKHYTKYECSQEMRRMETEMRKHKERYLALKESGDEEGAAAERAKVRQISRDYDLFCKESGLTPQKARARVDGYR